MIYCISVCLNAGVGRVCESEWVIVLNTAEFWYKGNKLNGKQFYYWRNMLQLLYYKYKGI